MNKDKMSKLTRKEVKAGDKKKKKVIKEPLQDKLLLSESLNADGKAYSRMLYRNPSKKFQSNMNKPQRRSI